MANNDVETPIRLMKEYGCTVEPAGEENVFDVQSRSSRFQLVIRDPHFLERNNIEP